MKRKTLFAIATASLLLLSLALAYTTTPASGGPEFENDKLVVRAYFDDLQMVDELANWTEPWEVDLEQGFVIVDVNEAGYERLISAGFQVEIDYKLTTAINEPREMLPGQDGGIPGYACYRTVEETFQTAEQLVIEYPHLATWIDIGDSWDKTTPGGPEGYDIKVLRLGNETIAGPKPPLYIFGSIHAREYASAELATRFAEYLLDNYGLDPDATWLLDYHEIHIVLQANPDGRKKAETGLSWRKNVNNTDGCSISTSYGVDLNRNFEFYWNSGGSSGDPCDTTFRGSSAASEPETQALQNYGWSIFQDQREDPITSPAPITTTGIFIDLHSYGSEFLWSWGWTSTTPPNHSGIRTLARKMGYFNDYDASHRGYAVSGTTKDFFYGQFGVPGYTVELGTAFFESCSYFENIIWPDNMPTLTYAAKASRFSYITPAGPDAVDISLSSTAVPPGDPVTLSAIINDARYNNSQGTEPVQNINAAEYYIDVPPWVTETVPMAVPMTPVDGSFDNPQETVEASIDTSSLANGRHLVYVRGQDADGNWGAFSAEFLFIIDPVAAPKIQGQVVAADSGQPLEATVSAGSFFQTTTDPSGYYEMRVVSGTYDITAVPASQDYASASVSGIDAHDYETIDQDFSLFPYCPLFEDDVEAGNMGWTAESPWAITEENSHSPIHSWTDSPGGSYPNNQDASLYSPVFDLTVYEGITLSFWHICNTESGYDYCQVEVSTDRGTSWGVVAEFDGLDTQWEEISLAIPELDGQPEAMLRFRLVSDGSIVADGWHIDDISLLGSGPNCVDETVPSASFVSSSPDPLGTITVFTNTSTGGGLSFDWDFGDGSPLSSNANPTHLYALTGTYSVTLTITNSLGTDVAVGIVEIFESDSVPDVFLPLLMINNQEAIKP